MTRPLILALALAGLLLACQADDPPTESQEESTPAEAPVKVPPPPVVENGTPPAEAPAATPEKAKPEEPKPAPSAAKRWIEQLESEDAGLRFAAAVELGKAGNLEAVGPLVTTLKEDRDYFVRRAAARSLGELGSDEAVPALIETLGDVEVFVTMSAQKALEKITGKRFETAEEWSAWWAKEESAGTPGQPEPEEAKPEEAKPEQPKPEQPKPEEPKPSPSAVKKWIGQLESKKEGERFEAAVELGRAGDLDAVGPLVSTLKEDRDYFVRRAAARSLGELGSREAVPALIETLGDVEVFVTMSAQKALEKITGKRFGTAEEWSSWWAKEK